MTEVDPKYLDILKRYDTPTVCNVIELFDVRPRSWGFMDGSIEALFPKLPPIVGYATTATFRSAHPRSEDGGYASLVDQVRCFEEALPRPRIVVFQDLDEGPCGATFGEVMCTVYKSFGCVGLITNGGSRDLDQIEAKDFACFATSVIASHANNRIVDVHLPVTVGGCLIQPGMLIHADRNGITSIPRELAAEVALGCEKFVTAESEVFDELAGKKEPTIEGLARAIDRMRSRHTSIVKEVRKELDRNP